MKFLKWFLILLGALILIMFLVVLPYTKSSTKKHSPETTATYNQNGYNLTAIYSSPFKKGRVIFGELVPYGKVWRTGANEPTTFESNVDLVIKGATLPQGKYSLWTIPKENSWNVIFNKDIPGWGVGWGSKSARDPEFDVVNIEVPVKELSHVQESFTIDFSDKAELMMNLIWDDISVSVPISK